MLLMLSGRCKKKKKKNDIEINEPSMIFLRFGILVNQPQEKKVIQRPWEEDNKRNRNT